MALRGVRLTHLDETAADVAGTAQQGYAEGRNVVITSAPSGSAQCRAASHEL